MATNKRRKGRQKSKAARATADSREERREAKRNADIENHPDAIEFEGGGNALSNMRSRIQPTLESDEEIRRKSIRNGILMAALVGGGSAWMFWFLF